MFGRKKFKTVAGHDMSETEYKYAKTEYEHYIIDSFAKEIHPITYIKQILFDYDDEIYSTDKRFNTNECIDYLIEHAEFKNFAEWLMTDFINQTEFYMTPEWDKDRENRKDCLIALQARLKGEDPMIQTA